MSGSIPVAPSYGSMNSGFWPRSTLRHTQVPSPHTPQRWSVSARITLSPLAGGGSATPPLGEIQSAGLASRTALSPPGHMAVIPTGWRFLISAIGVSNGRISEYTESSRRRLAMSCVY